MPKEASFSSFGFISFARKARKAADILPLFFISV